MMFNNLSELREKIYLGEDSTIEFKEQLPNRESLADEIAAFANAKGGTILIGVTDNGDIIGIDSNKLTQCEKTVIEICRDSIEPEVNIHTEKLSINKIRILKIEIPQSLFVHRSTNGYFRRQGSSKRELKTEALARLLQSRSQTRIIPFDEQAVPNTGKETLQEYRHFIRDDTSEKETEDLLTKRRLLVKDSEGKKRASVAGVLMCHKKPDEYLYGSLIQAVCYRGEIKDANYQVNAKELKGTLDQQILNAFTFVKLSTTIFPLGRKQAEKKNLNIV